MPESKRHIKMVEEMTKRKKNGKRFQRKLKACMKTDF